MFRRKIEEGTKKKSWDRGRRSVRRLAIGVLRRAALDRPIFERGRPGDKRPGALAAAKPHFFVADKSNARFARASALPLHGCDAGRAGTDHGAGARASHCAHSFYPARRASFRVRSEEHTSELP